MNPKTDLWIFLIAFAAAFAFALVLIPLLKKLKAGQSILKYVDMHAAKSGTPTMGGIIFILPVAVASIFVLRADTPLSIVLIISSLGYALVGFLDDLLKIKGKQNQGLKAYQKILGQGGIAALVSYFFMTANPTGEIFIPFFNTFADLGGAGIFALSFLVLISATNAVNLTDGIDGLAGSTSLVYFLFIYALILIMGVAEEAAEFGNIIAAAAGSLAAYLLFNTKKASVFMGDTGSLFLGGLIAAVSLFSYLGFVILILGAVFVWSVLSVIMQVVYFKLTKGKRIFRMTPFHHHLEKGGMSEPKIVAIYTTVTALAGIILIISII